MSHSSSRPARINLAIFLSYLACIGSMGVFALSGITSLLMEGILVALIVLITYFCALGYNWARILLVIYGMINILMVCSYAYNVINTVSQGASLTFLSGLSQTIQALAIMIISAVAPFLLFWGKAGDWFNGVKAHTIDRPSLGGTAITAIVVVVSMAGVGGTRIYTSTFNTLPPEIIVDVNNQLTEIREEMAKLDGLVTELDGFETADPPFPGMAADDQDGSGFGSLENSILMLHFTLKERGTVIYYDVRNRYPQLSERQRFAVASMIGNALQVNAKYYLLSDRLSEEKGGIIRDPGFDLNDTSQNLPDPKL